MPRILVTGATGFLARAVIRDLRGRGPVFKASRHGSAGVRPCDLTDPAQARALVAAARPSEVYHLVGDTRSAGWDGMWRAHVTTTVNLLEALAARGQPVR